MIGYMTLVAQVRKSKRLESQPGIFFFFFKKVTFVIDRSFFISYCLIVRYSYVMLRTRTRQSVSFGFKNNTLKFINHVSVL